MTRRARCREAARHMVGVRCALEVRLMTIDAILVKARKDIVDMAARTRYGLMCAGERK